MTNVRIELAFRPPDIQPRQYCGALVVDVLRATSVMVTLTAGGAPQVLLARSIRHARVLKRNLGPGWYTSGARRGHRVRGFDFANAMRDFVALDLPSFRFIVSTTNGTKTIYRTWSLACPLWVGSLLNATATAHAMARCLDGADEPFLVVLSGMNGRYSLDDALTAGLILDRLSSLVPNCDYSDEARTCWLMARNVGDIGAELKASVTGRALEEVGLGAEVDFTLQVDRYSQAVAVEEGDDGTLGLKVEG